MEHFCNGDMVEYFGWYRGCEFNPEPGTIGRVTNVMRAGRSVLVRWPDGSTKAEGGDEWWISPELIRHSSTVMDDVDCEQLDEMFAEFDN